MFSMTSTKPSSGGPRSADPVVQMPRPASVGHWCIESEPPSPESSPTTISCRVRSPRWLILGSDCANRERERAIVSACELYIKPFGICGDIVGRSGRRGQPLPLISHLDPPVQDTSPHVNPSFKKSESHQHLALGNRKPQSKCNSTKIASPHAAGRNRLHVVRTNGWPLARRCGRDRRARVPHIIRRRLGLSPQ